MEFRKEDLCEGCGEYHGPINEGIECLLTHLRAARVELRQYRDNVNEFREWMAMWEGNRNLPKPWHAMLGQASVGA
jgi:hypothetical protein